MRTSSSSTWTADSGARRASALRPQPAPPKLACSEGPGPGPGAAGAPRQSCGLSPGGNTPRELREAAALLLHPPVVSVILPLTQRTCWLLEAPPEHPSGASPKTPSLTPAVSRRRPVAPVPLLPVSQTLGQGRGLSPSPHRLRDQALERDVAYQDSILCLQTVATLAMLGAVLTLLPRSAAEPPVLSWMPPPLRPPRGPKFLWLVQGLWRLGRAGPQEERTLRPLQPSRYSSSKGCGQGPGECSGKPDPEG